MGIKKKRKEETFKELFEENYSRLFYASLFIVNSEEDAHDIVEDYFLDLWEEFDPEAKEYSKTYLYNGIKHKSLDFLKHENVKNKYAQLYLALNNEYNLSFNEEEEDRMVVIERVMQEMPPRTKFVFEQCYFENKKYEEVAEILGLSRDGVRKIIIKGLTMLRNAFSVKYKKGQGTKRQ